MDFKEILTRISSEIKPFINDGAITGIIPELSAVDPDKFGISLIHLDGSMYTSGHHDTAFSIQSISKALTLPLAVGFLGEQVWERVGVEPSGNPFNSLVQLEYEKGKPRNPFINAGAIVIADILVSHLDDPQKDFLHFIRTIADSETINYNQQVAASEKQHGYRNAALANFLKSFDNLENNVDEVLDFYFHQCSIEMNCDELARSFLLFANGGIVPRTGERLLSSSETKRLNALMQTCGFYDESGEFTYKVGLPGKSGIGGGIAALHPKEFSVAVWSPRLNNKGNSVLGMKALELLTTYSGMSIF